MRMVRLMAAIVSGTVALACDGASPTAPTPTVQLRPEAEVRSGVDKQAISGMIQFVTAGPPERVQITPGGICHFWDNPVLSEFQGDVTGPVTFNEQNHLSCAGGHLVASGPFTGDVTWNGRSGSISGQFTTNCKGDPSQPIGVSCDGTMNARGSGGLEGVQFHFEWGPGWWPFAYVGTAFSQ